MDKKLVEEKINDAVARYHVIRFELPKKALVPASYMDALVQGFPQYADPGINIRTFHMEISAGKDVGNLEVEVGKVPEITLYRGD